ncbi:MAG: hypothetical protein OSJ51_10355, partial [Parabacteroides distasonis]|nr:hypothetical protein [Parabacteroides distasonis]
AVAVDGYEAVKTIVK